jgi:hypothetical protein
MVKKMNEVCEYANQPTILPPRWCCVACHFPHWVWVYGVESALQSDPQNIKAFGYDQKVVKVYFTGDNIYAGDYGDLWPAGLYDDQGNKKMSFVLPWMVSYSYVPGTTTMISNTIMIWYWQQYTIYDKNNPRQYPDIFTRYYDGSP